MANAGCHLVTDGKSHTATVEGMLPSDWHVCMLVGYFNDCLQCSIHKPVLCQKDTRASDGKQATQWRSSRSLLKFLPQGSCLSFCLDFPPWCTVTCKLSMVRTWHRSWNWSMFYHRTESKLRQVYNVELLRLKTEYSVQNWVQSVKRLLNSKVICNVCFRQLARQRCGEKKYRGIMKWVVSWLLPSASNNSEGRNKGSDLMQSFKAVRLHPILARPSISLRIFDRRSYEP